MSAPDIQGHTLALRAPGASGTQPWGRLRFDKGKNYLGNLPRVEDWPRVAGFCLSGVSLAEGARRER